MATTFRPIPIDLKPGQYKAVKAIVLIPGALLLGAILIWLIRFFIGYDVSILTVLYEAALFLPLAVYYFASSYFVQTDELAGVTVLENPAEERKQGFAFAPLWLTELLRYPRPVQQVQFPAEPEMISNLPDDESERMGDMLMRPIRITTGGPEKGEEFKDNILNEQLTLEPTITIRWQIELQGFFEFYVNTPGKSWAEKKQFILQSMRDTAENALNEEMSMHSAAWCIAKKKELIEKVHQEIIDKVGDWGIIVCEVNILNLTPASHAVNSALGEIPAAKARGQARVIEATNAKAATILESEGTAQATINVEAAKGEGIKQAAEAIGISGADYRNGEIAKTAFGDKTVVLGVDGIAEVMNLGKKLKEIVK